MNRQLVRIAALALCTGALGGCGMLGGDGGSPTAPPPGEHADNLAGMGPGVDVTGALVQAQALRSKGDLEGATRVLSQLMLAEPDDARVVGEYGKLLVQKGRSDDAVQFLNRAIELQPSEWSYYSALGVAYDQKGDHPSAKTAYEHALVLKPDEPAVLNNFAMSRMLAGDTVQARALLTRAQASGSTDPKIARNVALLDGMTAGTAPAPANRSGFPVAPPPTRAVASNTLPVPPAAHGAPQPLTRGGAQVVMQAVPVDPLAGPVAPRHPAKSDKPAPRQARNAAHDRAAHDRHVAAAAPAKPAKPAKDHVPALRMTADASKP
ncbi:MAG: tetratricopeptide repeat protein [Rhizomicrobium sp.]